MDRKQLTFPIFNAVICAIAGGVIGFLIRVPIEGLLMGAGTGLTVGAAVEMANRGRSPNWLYRRRVLLAALLEIPFAMFIAGPYADVVMESQPHHYEVCCETPLDYGAETYEEVKVDTTDGIRLVGWFVPPREKPGAVVVLLHGGGGDRRGAGWHARELIAAGYGIFTYDQRGLGESTGDRISLGWQYPEDLRAVVRYLQGRPDVDPGRIGAVGLSRGAHIAMNGAYEQPRCFAGLWLEGMGAETAEDFPRPRNGAEKFEKVLNASALKMAEIRFGKPPPPTIRELLTGLKDVPMMLISAGMDEYESRIGEVYASAHGPKHEIWAIPNAWHTGGPTAVPDEYRSRMLRFFEEAFKEPAGECGS